MTTMEVCLKKVFEIAQHFDECNQHELELLKLCLEKVMLNCDSKPQQQQQPQLQQQQQPQLQQQQPQLQAWTNRNKTMEIITGSPRIKQSPKIPELTGIIIDETESGIEDICGIAGCGCVYRFRGENDPVRNGECAINQNELFVGGLPDTMVWNDLRQELKNELGKLKPNNIFVPPGKRFAFLTFGDHKSASNAQKTLRECNFFGVNLFVNFACEQF